MKILSRQETIIWCGQHEIALNDFGLPERSDTSVKFIIPADAQKRVNLVSRAMATFSSSPLVLVWFAKWAVWLSGQRMHVFNRFRMSYVEIRRLIDAHE